MVKKQAPKKQRGAYTIFFCVLLFILYPFVFYAQDSTALYFGSKIQKGDISRCLLVLSSDSLEGRETGKPGQKKAAAFISEYFSSLGLQAVSHGGYLQQHPISTKNNRGKNIEVNQKYFLFMKDYFYQPGLNDTLIVLDSVRFVGYGISAKEYDDFEKLDVAGKAILFFDGSPVYKKIDLSSWARDRKKKLDIINSKKPSLVFIVCDSIDKTIDSLNYLVKQEAIQNRASKEYSAPLIFISYEMAEAFFTENDREGLYKTKSYIDRKNKPRSLRISTSAFVRVVKNTDELMGDNVIGYLEGSDKKDEVIILTAHYDHLGMRDSLIHRGADDNSSGTSAILVIANAFSKAKKDGHGPRRSIAFIAFSGEEKGLQGSLHYTNHPIFPLENTVANLNCDMIGRTDEKYDSLRIKDYVYIIGSDKLSSELHKINETANSTYTKLKLDYQYNSPDDKNRYYYRSDHYNFAKHRVPVVFYYNGEHADYHKPSDTVDKIDYDLLVKRAQLIFYTTWELVNRDERIYPDVNIDTGQRDEK